MYNKLYLYYGKLGHVVHECPKKHGPHVAHTIFCYQSTMRGVEKRACPLLMGIARLNFDASCNENACSLSSNPTPCFLLSIIVKCYKLLMTEAQTFLILTH